MVRVARPVYINKASEKSPISRSQNDVNNKDSSM